MKNVFKTFAVASTIALSASLAWAAGTHPITGEALADDLGRGHLVACHHWKTVPELVS
jgi:myo-inositol catabolism protein IolC